MSDREAYRLDRIPWDQNMDCVCLAGKLINWAEFRGIKTRGVQVWLGRILQDQNKGCAGLAGKSVGRAEFRRIKARIAPVWQGKDDTRKK